MAIPFGFSVGDILAGLKLIVVSVEAVKGAHSSQSDYASLLAEINALRSALEAIDDLDLERRGTEKQWAAMQGSITSCKNCIDEFLARVGKYQPHLQEGAKGGWVAGYRKIKWAVCRTEDVTRFRAQLERHTSSIGMLLNTFQAKETMDAARRENGSKLGSDLEVAT